MVAVGDLGLHERANALISLGYKSPTFSAGMPPTASSLPLIAWQAERDGERVRGVIKSLGGDQWEVAEIEEDED